jgi:hypothetical protein
LVDVFSKVDYQAAATFFYNKSFSPKVHSPRFLAESISWVISKVQVLRCSLPLHVWSEFLLSANIKRQRRLEIFIFTTSGGGSIKWRLRIDSPKSRLAINLFGFFAGRMSSFRFSRSSKTRNMSGFSWGTRFVYVT